MSTTHERSPAVTGRSRARPTLWGAAAAFAISSVWFALIETGVTQAPAPETVTASRTDALRAGYAWFTGTLLQERAVTGVAILAFALLVVSVWALRARLGSGPAATAGALIASLGSVLWVVGNVVQLGGHRAVGLMATHGNPLETVNAIAFTVDTIDDAAELVAFALLAAGMLCISVGAWHLTGAAGAWSRYTAAFAAALLALAVSHGLENGDAANVLLVAVGALLTPAWLLWADRIHGVTG